MQVDSNCVITVENTSKRFADVAAVNNVSMSMREGQITGLLGPNGAGKTTLINLLLGRLIAAQGQISIAGHAPGTMAARQQIGAILQSTQLPDTLTIKEHIELFSSYYKMPMPMDEVIAITGLEDLTKRRFNTLSGGQKQRLYFALSICGNPKVVFLDEPTVGLDAQARREFWQCMRDLAERGTSILLTTHYLEEADALAEQVYLMHRGEITHKGTPDSLKAALGGKKIRFISDLDTGFFMRFADVQQVIRNNLHVELQSSNAEHTLAQLFAENTQIQDLVVEQSSLEEAFINLTANHSAELGEQR